MLKTKIKTHLTLWLSALIGLFTLINQATFAFQVIEIGYNLTITQLHVYNKGTTTQCNANEECQIVIDVSKTGTSNPGTDITALLKINGQFIQNSAGQPKIPKESLGIGSLGVNFTFPQIVKFSPGTSSTIEITLAEGQTTKAQYQINFTPSAEEAPPTIKINIGSTDNPNPPCTENSTKDNDSKLCQNGSYIICDYAKEGIKSADSKKQCNNNKWITLYGSDDETPPGFTINTNGNPTPPPGNIKITKADVYPKGFNPTVTSSKITYAINNEAIIEIKIVDLSGQTVTKLIDDKPISAGEYSVTWYGTSDNKQGSTVLASGTYEYKISAKNPQNGNIEDTADGEINLIYFTPGTQPPNNNPPPDNNQAKATTTLQNSTTGKTVKTGPGLIIYSILPLAGYLLSRKKRNHD